MIATPLSTSGRFIVDAHGKRVRLAGVNWYGASEDFGVPAGLEYAQRSTLAKLIAAQGFNSVRFPFSVWMTEQTTPVPNQYLAANPDLFGKTPLEVYDACVRALTEEGLIVIPNCHLMDFGWCCAADDGNGLWFNDRWAVAKFTAAWQNITKRYASNPLVAAMDVKNEPRQATVAGKTLNPTWTAVETAIGKLIEEIDPHLNLSLLSGSGNLTDFAAMYAMMGDLIHQIDPHVLIICEGLGFATSLAGVAASPVKLKEANKLVYSMHDYSWSGHPQGQSQAAYLEQMHTTGGYILSENIAPIWIGECGQNTDNEANFTSGWWPNLQAWITQNDIDWCYWALNPTHAQGCTPGTNTMVHAWGSPEPFGLLTPDWSGIKDPTIMNMLKSMIKPKTGPGI
jgi:endoglucanase